MHKDKENEIVNCSTHHPLQKHVYVIDGLEYHQTLKIINNNKKIKKIETNNTIMCLKCLKLQRKRKEMNAPNQNQTSILTNLPSWGKPVG